MPRLIDRDRLADASALLQRCVRDSPEVRGGAILGPHGEQVFATDGRSWAEPVGELWRLAEAGTGEVAYLHVGAESGEVLAVRGAGGCAVMTSDRFPLAALVLSDLRAVLRELDAKPVGSP
jgi:hypothetical protein